MATASRWKTAASSGQRRPEPLLKSMPMTTANWSDRLAPRQPAPAGAIAGDRIRIRADHVIRTWSRVSAVTSNRSRHRSIPEAGAYAPGTGHHHDHDHGLTRPLPIVMTRVSGSPLAV